MMLVLRQLAILLIRLRVVFFVVCTLRKLPVIPGILRVNCTDILILFCVLRLVALRTYKKPFTECEKKS